MTLFEWLLIIAVVIIILTPAKYDPAILWKEFNERWAERLRMRRK